MADLTEDASVWLDEETPVGIPPALVAPVSTVGLSQTQHVRLPNERPSITHKFVVGNQKGYITVGLYPDGRPAEVFLVLAKKGSTLRGLFHLLAITTSVALQHGVPLKKILKKWIDIPFEPQGFTKNPKIPIVRSIGDYLARYLGTKFLSPEELTEIGIAPEVQSVPPTNSPPS